MFATAAVGDARPSAGSKSRWCAALRSLLWLLPILLFKVLPVMLVKINKSPLYVKPSPGSRLCFRLDDCEGDGNCYFRGLVKSPHCPFDDYLSLKRDMSDRLADTSPDREHLAPIFKHYIADSEPIDIEHWRERIRHPREWE